MDAAEENDRDGELFEIVAEEALHFTEAESFDMPILIIHADELAHEASSEAHADVEMSQTDIEVELLDVEDEPRALRGGRSKGSLSSA